MNRYTLRFLLAGLFACFGIANAAADDAFPAKAVKIVVPYPPGGPYDTIARVVGQKLGESFGQPFVVENRAGANGSIGASAVATSAPDGYTLLVGGIGPNAINGSLYSKLPYNPRDFTPIVQVLSSPNVLVVNPGVKANSVAELVTLARSADQGLSYASAGAGSSTHLFAVLFAQANKLGLRQVTYKGDAPAIMATISGETPMYFASAASILPHVKGERVRALAVTGSRRLPALPSVPTLNEAGVTGYEATAWYGFFAPKGTPKNVVDKLNRQINAALQEPEVRAKLESGGSVEVVGGSPEAFAALVDSETVKWKNVIDSGGITVD